jgi:hypothetical protein
VTETIARPPSAAPAQPRVGGSAGVTTGITHALGAGALGLLTALSLVLVGWATDGHSTGSVASILRAAARLWLLAHRTPMDLRGGRLVLAPLGLTLLAAVFVARAATTAVRRGDAPRGRESLTAALAVVVPYAVMAGVVAGLAGDRSVRPSPTGALAGSAAVAAAAALAGWARAQPSATPSSWLPASAAAVVAASGAALAVLLGAGAVLAAASLATDWSAAGRLSGAVAEGAPAGVALLLAQLLLLPNAVVWASGYALGTGFAVGAGTAVAPTGVTLGAVPALPMLAGLPQSGGAPAMSLISLAGPALAAVIAGVVLARRLEVTSPARAAAWMLAVAGTTAGALGVLAWLSAGGAPGRLSELGPAPLRTALAAALWLTVVGAPAAALTTRRNRASS